MQLTRNIITLATSKKVYIDLAVNLARSFIWWHPNTDIKFHIVTDQSQFIPNNIKKKVKVIEVKSWELGQGFSAKLFLDQLSPGGQTLFIDSDCLIFSNLDFLFNRFKGNNVSVVGSYIQDGEWFGDIAKICSTYGIDQLPKFNGGIYYLEKGPKSLAVYDMARALERKYDEIGFVRLRDLPNDEVIMALAMELHQEKPIADDGQVMSDPQSCQGGYDIHVLTGKRWLINPPKPHQLHQNWYPFEKVEPAIIHFLGHYTEHYPYKREVYLLRHAFDDTLNKWIEFKAKINIEYPMRIKTFLKKTFRPAYHFIFGNRKIKKSNRI